MSWRDVVRGCRGVMSWGMSWGDVVGINMYYLKINVTNLWFNDT